MEFERCEDAARAMNANRSVFSKRDSSGRKDVSLPMTVETHRTKNFSRGVIFCMDLEGVSDGEIEEGLAGFGVIAARRIRTRRGRELVPTHSVILTFNSTDLPREVKVGYLSVKVRQLPCGVSSASALATRGIAAGTGPLAGNARPRTTQVMTARRRP